MDAFEYIVGLLFEREGYWVRRNVRVELTAEDNKKIGKPKSPRRELDIVAYKADTNELIVVECKSFLDSRGVHPASYKDINRRGHKTYKLLAAQSYIRPLARSTTGNGLSKVGSVVNDDRLQPRRNMLAIANARVTVICSITYTNLISLSL